MADKTTLSKYELTPPEKQTMKLLREKGAFGLVYLHGKVGVWIDTTDNDKYYSDEAAYALMCRRGLKALGEMWRVQGCFAEYSTDALLKRLAFFCVPRRDMLGAIMAALEDKR